MAPIEGLPLSRRSEEAMASFQEKIILVLGDVFVDEYLMGDTNRISPEAPVPILRVKETHATLGGAANTAANIASLGGKAVLIGLVGEDQAARQVASLCARAGVEMHPIADGRPTIRKTRVVGQRQQLLRLDWEETHEISADGERAILERFRAALPSAHMVVMSDYAKGFFTRPLCQAIIAEAHAAGKEVIIDPRPEHGSFYEGCDYLTPNWKEAQGLAGVPGGDSDATREAIGRALSGKLGANILMTLGAKGMEYFGRDGSRFAIPTETKEVFDVSGAGDTVVAMFALARASGCGVEESIVLANRAAGIVVGKLGTATVTREEVSGRAYGARRLVSRQELAPLARQLRMQGRRIVTLNGSFDVLHAGHLYIISEARKQGDVLIVGLNSDASVRGYKGPSRPIIPQEERATMLLALRDVDYVHIFDEAVPMPFLREIAPDVHANGSEYGHECIEAETVKGMGGRIHIVEKIPGLSTSGLLEKIKSQIPKT